MWIVTWYYEVLRLCCISGKDIDNSDEDEDDVNTAHRDVIKDDFGGKLPSGCPWTSARFRIYPADAVLPADRFLPTADAVQTVSTRMQ
jgi:hypothetical protein